MTDRLEGVSTFVQVVDAGGFSLAAERLGIGRSAVGKAIARLEARLGVRLLQRSTRRQTLTAEGHAYYERCVRALAELDTAEAELESGRIAPSGRLRVSVPEAFGHLCAAPVLLGLTRRHPGLDVELSFSDRTVDLIEEGFDLAVRIGELDDRDTLAARRLGAQHVAIGASRAYLAKHGTPRRLEDLAGHSAIAYARGGTAAPWNAAADRYGVRWRIRLDDVQAIAAAAVSGFGLAWMPSWLLARHVKTGDLVPVLDGHRAHSSSVHAVWPRSRHLRGKTRVAIDALVAAIPAQLA